MEMQPNRVEWKGLTDTQCPVCDWLLMGNMVHHIHQNHTECVTSGNAHLKHIQRGESPSWQEIVLRGSPWVPTQMVLATGVSYKLHQDVWPVPWGLYEYSTLHNRSCTMDTSFPTHKFTYILPGILYHPDVENPVDHERSGIDPLACPMYWTHNDHCHIS